MTSVVIVADSGPEMARVTSTVQQIRGMEIVRHAPCPVVLTRPPTLLSDSHRTLGTFGTVNA